MPLDFDPTEIVAHSDVTIQARETVVGEVQANVTFRVTTTGRRPLGQGGELSGIAKLDPKEALQYVKDARDRAMEDAMTRLGEIAQEIEQKLSTDTTLTEQERTRLGNQRTWIQNKLQSDNRTIVDNDRRALPDYVTDPVLLKAMTLQIQVVSQAGNYNILETLSGRPMGEGDDTATLTRAVGTSKLDQLLGTGVISEERYGVDEQGRSIGVSVRVDGVGVLGTTSGGGQYQLEIDYSRHEVQKGLYDLEVIDYITGQIDRHPGNIFIDPETGEVKGIDNDLCFPSRSREEMFGDLREAKGKPVENKPLYMHEDTARRIEELSPEQLRETLGTLKYPGRGERGRLSPEEINGAVTRLEEMKQHVVELRRTGHVVTKFTKGTYDEAINHQKNAFTEEDPRHRSLDELTDPRPLNSTTRTSYLGSIHCEQVKTEVTIKAGEEDVRERLDFEGVLAATNSTGKSTRSEEGMEFARLEKERREELRPFKTAPVQEDFDRLNERVARMERRLERLEHPNLWDKFRAIWHGGVEGAKEVFKGKRQEALDDIDARKEVIEQNLNQVLDDESGGRWREAERNVQNRRLQQDQGQNLGLHQSQKVDINVGEEVDGRFVLNPEKLSMLDKSSHKPGFALKEPTEIRVDDDSSNEVDLDEPKSELQKQGSVRDLLKDSKGGKDLKPKNEVEIEDDTVRSQVVVKKGDTETQKGQSVKL